MDKIIQSKKFKTAAIIAGVILCALLIFALGISVGMHKGRFSCNFGKNYERNFMGQREGMKRQGFMPGPPMELGNKGFRNAHGIAGQIISISDNKIVLKNRDNQENTIAVSDKTLIKSQQSDLKISDLKSGDEIVVMGKPDESGVVNADLIRIFTKVE
ncbi:MAG TPA: hypothetical protein P5232_01580 [Candidatus Moranbacteria bacterium]|nr:hypothetical protein [Candidatus Moranbacteria bacterium]